MRSPLQGSRTVQPLSVTQQTARFFFKKKNQPPSSNMSMTYQQQAAMRRRASTSGHMGSDSFRDMGTSNCHIGSLIIGEQVRELPARTSFVEIEPGLFETDIVQTEDRPMLAFTFSQGSLHPSVLGRYVIFRERLFQCFRCFLEPLRSVLSMSSALHSADPSHFIK